MTNLSLVLFTCFAQAAVGMSLLLAIMPCKSADNPGEGSAGASCSSGCALVTALILLVLGVLFSLLHLSSPLISFYSITNVATSWLSREILFVGLFGVALLATFFVKSRVLKLLAALLGLAMVYVMSWVYISTPVLFWKNILTFWVFLSTSLLLGFATLLLIKSIGARAKSESCQCCQRLPLLVAAAAGMRLVAGLVQLVKGFEAPVCFNLLYLHMGGVVLALLVLFMAVQAGKKDSEAQTPVGLIFLAVLLFWAAEICGRMMFYDAISSFTM